MSDQHNEELIEPQDEALDQNADETVENTEAQADNSAAETEMDPLAKAEKDLAEMKDKYLRLYAEFDNYRRRTSRERLELGKVASRELMVAMLPVVDDFKRAQKVAESSEEAIPEGLELIINKFYQILQNQGLSPMESTGQNFDVELHEAVTEFPAPSEDLKGKVIDTLESGYFLNDVIIRYAKVVVGK